MPPVKKLAYDPYDVLQLEAGCSDTQIDKGEPAWRRAR